MTATGNLGQAQAHSQPPLAKAPWCSSAASFQNKRPFLQSSRHTGEVPEGRRGKASVEASPDSRSARFQGSSVLPAPSLPSPV
jgi:hypothetical protein